MTAPTTTRPRVVVIGGGFGGLAAVRGLRNADVDVTLVDRHAYNTFQPLLYQVATASLNPGDITYFLRAIRDDCPNATVVNGDVVTIDHEARTVGLADGRSIDYDYLVIASGVTANYFGIPGAEEHSLPLYTRAQALELRDAIVASLEKAARVGHHDSLRIVVIGAGATGVETAGALAEMRNVDLPVTYPELDTDDTHVTLVEMADTVLPPFSEVSRDYARQALEKRGVDLRLGTTVKEVRADGVVVNDGELIPAGIVVWASGITAPEVVGSWHLPQGKGGRIEVDDHLQVKGLKGVYAVGDIAIGPDALPQLAQPALQGGEYVAHEILGDLDGRHQPPFHYNDKGILATIGRSSAVAEATGLPKMQGLPAWLIWTGVHIFTLLGNRNRLAAMVNLGAKYVFWHRGHNAIVGDTPTAVEAREGRVERAVYND